MDGYVCQRRRTDILEALKKILRPSVSGNAVYQEVVFAETMDLLDRMVLTESLSMQAIIVEIARNLCLVHPSSRHGEQAHVNGEALSDDIEQLFELTRIIILVISGLVPGLSETPPTKPFFEEERTFYRDSSKSCFLAKDLKALSPARLLRIWKIV